MKMHNPSHPGNQPTDISRINRRQYWPHVGADPGVCHDVPVRKERL